MAYAHTSSAWSQWLLFKAELMASSPPAQRLPKLVKSGTDSRLDGAERLIQPRRDFGMRQFGEERGLDRLLLVRREDRQGILQRPSLLLELENIVGFTRLNRREWIARMRFGPLLPPFEAQPVDGPGARLVHDPSQDGPVTSVVAGGSSPNIVKDIERQLFGGFPVAGDSHDQCEDEAMRSLVQRVQRELIARGDGLDEPDPGFLRFDSLRLVAVKNIAERSGWAFRPILCQTLRRFHGLRGFHGSDFTPPARRLSGLTRQ